MPFSRRQFLGAAGTLGLGISLCAVNPHRRAAIIGNSTAGGFGHDLDGIFKGRPGISLVGLADPDAAGREKMVKSTGAARGYADWHELLEKERPELVCIAMRHADQHAAIALACLEAGAHVYIEKPFARSCAEADQVLAAARRRRLKVAVAHTMRMAPVTLRLREALRNGLIGEVRELRAFGKQDTRAGGEDMMVLGTHLFDLMRAFVGDPEFCAARVLHQGRPITPTDRRLVKDNVGWVAGDQVFAHFSFAKGVNATFTSDSALRETQAHWGIELLGSKGAVRFNGDIAPSVHVRSASAWSTTGRVEEWKGFEPGLAKQPFEHNAAPVTDWLEAIDRDREPECSGTNGAACVEMVMAVYQASLLNCRVSFPLKQRVHPLEG